MDGHETLDEVWCCGGQTGLNKRVCESLRISDPMSVTFRSGCIRFLKHGDSGKITDTFAWKVFFIFLFHFLFFSFFVRRFTAQFWFSCCWWDQHCVKKLK